MRMSREQEMQYKLRDGTKEIFGERQNPINLADFFSENPDNQDLYKQIRRAL